tara:strand:- start:395 stop:637 length:243 start_codon:yes stop_codon:yes gene_type:complete
MTFLCKFLLVISGCFIVWFFYITLEDRLHKIWDIAYKSGYAQAESYYKGILEIELSDSIVAARCKLREEAWINEYNRKDK